MRQKHEIFEQGLSYIPYPKHMRKMCLPNKIIPNMDIHNYFDKYYYAFISDLKKIKYFWLIEVTKAEIWKKPQVMTQHSKGR